MKTKPFPQGKERQQLFNEMNQQLPCAMEFINMLKNQGHAAKVVRLEINGEAYGEKLPPKEKRFDIKDVVQKYIESHPEPVSYIETLRQQKAELKRKR